MPHLSNVKKNPPSPNVHQEGDVVFVKDVENHTLIGYKYFDFRDACRISVVTRGAAGVLKVYTVLDESAKPVGVSRSNRAPTGRKAWQFRWIFKAYIPCISYMKGKERSIFWNLSLHDF